ncbi:putative ribonuclease H-like domain-containing protein [Tanacetum coccineum]
MSQPANDEFSQHLSDDEELNHEDASDIGAAPKQQQQRWALPSQYFDNGCLEGNSEWKLQKRIQSGKDGIVRILYSNCCKHQAFGKKGRKEYLLMAISQEHLRRFHEWECTAKGTNDGKKKRDLFYQHQKLGSNEKRPMGLLTMDDGIANEIYEKDESLKDIGDRNGKLLKEKETMAEKTLDSWKESSKNLWRLINSGMSSNSYPRRTVDRGIFDNGCSGHHDRYQGSTEDLTIQWGILFTLVRQGPRHHNMYQFCQEDTTPAQVLPCLIAKATLMNLNCGTEILLVCLASLMNIDEDSLVVNQCHKGVGYRWMFDIDYLTDSMNYIPVSLENQANPHAGTSEVTNSAGTSHTPNTIASEENVKSRTSSTNSKKEEILTEPQQEKKVSSTDTSEDNPKIIAFRRELEEIALKHLGTVSENNSTSTPSVNTGNESVNTGRLDPDDSPMPELEIFHKSETGILMLHLMMTEEPKKIAEALQDDSWVQAMQEELLQFKLQQVWVLVDLPHGMKVIVIMMDPSLTGKSTQVQINYWDYGFNFMDTKIHIDNESTICIVKNPVYHSKTKHIETRHHFIRDYYEKKLISVENIPQTSISYEH